MLVASGLCAATAGFMPLASSALSFTAPSMLPRGGVAAASRARPVFASGDENEMEPEGGWGVDNLMDMMDAADDDDDEENTAVPSTAAAVPVASVQSWYDSGARLNGAAPEAIGTEATGAADDAVDSSTLFLLHFNKISAEGLQTIQRREWVNLIDNSRSNIERRQRVADEAPQHGQSAPWQCPSSAPAPPSGVFVDPGQLGTPRKRPAHWAPSHCLGCSSEVPPKPSISPPLTIQAPAAITRIRTQMLKEEGAHIIEARGARVGECGQILKLVRLKEEGGRVVQQREETCAAMVSLMPTRATALSAAAPDGFEWGPVF